MCKNCVGPSIPERLSTVGMDNPDALIQALSAILTQRLETIDQRITDVAKYYSDMLGLQETSLDRITDRLCLLENNYGRALALLEDRIKILEARANENVVYTSGLNTRICQLEDDELNAIDERLCRLESPGVHEIYPRATAGDQLRPVRAVRYYECTQCGADKPCNLRVDGPAILPEYCHYSGNAAAWQEVSK